MSRETELAKNTLILSIGKFLPKLAAIVTLPILTAHLTKADYGYYDLITTLVLVAIPIATLQIQSAAFRFLLDCRGNKQKSEEIISNIFIATLPMTILVCVVVLLFFGSIAIYTKVLIVVYFFLDTLFLTISQIVRGLGRNNVYSIGAVINSIVYMVMVIFTVYFRNMGLNGVMLALNAAQIVSIIYLCAAGRFFSYISFGNISWNTIKSMISYSWPMVPNNLSSWVLRLSDRLVITAFLGIEANAVYAVANKIPNFLYFAQSIMVMAWHENASIAAKDSDADVYYSKVLNRVFKLMYGCAVLLIAGTPLLFSLLIKGDYDQAYYQIPILIMAMFFCVMSSFFGGIYIAHKKTLNVGISTMVAAVVNLAIDLVFVRLIGIWAGSISTLVAYVVLYVYRMFNCQKFQPLRIDHKKNIILIIIMTLLLISCFMQKWYLNVINAVIAIILFIVLNKNSVISAFRILKKRLKGKRQ